jgi:two-component system, OmpR family, phosphate regulon sensor histidine kinase PhoR
MPVENSNLALATILKECQTELIELWREEAGTLPSALPLDQLALTDHIPDLVSEIIQDLALDREPSLDRDGPLAVEHAKGCSPVHGVQRFHEGFDLREVVAEYHVLRDAFQTIAERHRMTLAGEPARTINRRIDQAIGLAVEAFSCQRDIMLKEKEKERLAFFAHDLRTPLNAIGLVNQEIELCLDDKTRGEVGELLGVVSRNLQRLQDLVKREMKTNIEPSDESGVFHPERRQFELWPLVQRLVQDLSPLAAKDDIEVRNRVPHSLIVDADAGLLAQVFQNLLGNAFHYASGGMVTISAHEENGVATGVVQDSGEGIPPELLPTIFDKLKTDPGKDGTGLGLSIVKQIVEAHGGAVRVESTLGAGAVFSFTLPPAAKR